MKRPATTVGRRRFLKAVPAAVAATVTIPAALRAQRGAGATPPKFGKDVLKCAEQIDGLQFTDAEEEMAIGGASRNLDSYEELRKLNIPLDTEPAITFRPYRGSTRTSDQAPNRTSGPAALSASRSPNNATLAVAKPARVQVSANLDDLAFEPVTALASSIESRRITSTDITDMYPERLKRYQGGVWFGGSTRNPWSPDNSSSGSSAGPGAATSAGLVAFAIGTETRGSIISPSSTCGVVGLRPTYGRVSRPGGPGGPGRSK